MAYVAGFETEGAYLRGGAVVLAVPTKASGCPELPSREQTSLESVRAGLIRDLERQWQARIDCARDAQTRGRAAGGHARHVDLVKYVDATLGWDEGKSVSLLGAWARGEASRRRASRADYARLLEALRALLCQERDQAASSGRSWARCTRRSWRCEKGQREDLARPRRCGARVRPSKPGERRWPDDGSDGDDSTDVTLRPDQPARGQRYRDFGRGTVGRGGGRDGGRGGGRGPPSRPGVPPRRPTPPTPMVPMPTPPPQGPTVPNLNPPPDLRSPLPGRRVDRFSRPVVRSRRLRGWVVD